MARLKLTYLRTYTKRPLRITAEDLHGPLLYLALRLKSVPPVTCAINSCLLSFVLAARCRGGARTAVVRSLYQ
jgi:hypothetical protein